jgi:hypothetical protein
MLKENRKIDKERYNDTYRICHSLLPICKIRKGKYTGNQFETSSWRKTVINSGSISPLQNGFTVPCFEHKRI